MAGRTSKKKKKKEESDSNSPMVAGKKSVGTGFKRQFNGCSEGTVYKYKRLVKTAPKAINHHYLL